jgi:hypothetical protein
VTVCTVCETHRNRTAYRFCVDIAAVLKSIPPCVRAAAGRHGSAGRRRATYLSFNPHLFAQLFHQPIMLHRRTPTAVAGPAGRGGAGRGRRRATYLLVFLTASVQLFKETLLLHLRTRGDRFVSLLNICVYEVCVCAYMHMCVDADMRICVDADMHMTAQPRTYTRTLTCSLTSNSCFTRAARARLARPRHTFICARICIPISIYRRALTHTAGTDGCTSSRRACKRPLRSLAALDTRPSCG